ncbi:MAG: hypothetical protein IGS54_15625 [Elainella sp. C42_A2020_010]|nr:hypothetical protein [Elainella sp. C42_A2020_010]
MDLCRWIVIIVLHSQMTNHTATMSMFHRILAIDWQKNCLDSDFHVKLMAEYLRRSALWRNALQPSQPTHPLLFDIAACIDPTVRADSDLVEALLDHLNQFPISLVVKRVCEQALHWAAIRDTTQVQQFSLPDPYEPLLVLFEHDEIFSTEHGWIDVAGAGFQIQNWRDYAEKLPFVELDK